MFSSPIFKTTAITTVFIVAAASAQATTVASVELTNGTYETGFGLIPGTGIISIPTIGGPALQITADFDAGFTPFDLGLEQDFVLAAGLTVDGDELFDDATTFESISGFDLIDDALSLIGSLPPELLAILGNALGEILDGDTTPTEVDDGVFLNFEYDVTGGTETSVQGAFVATLTSEATASFFASPLTPSGTFSGYATLSTVAPVPLPASSLIMMSGLAGFAALRRKKMAQKA